MAAQVVALADVYDALVSERVYKHAFPHETAVAMIENGECGAFNPDLMRCFLEEADHLRDMIALRSDRSLELFDVGKLSREIMERGEPGLADRTVLLLERERAKFKFVASYFDGVLFDYDIESDTVVFSGRGRERFGLAEIVVGARGRELLAGTKEAIQELLGKSEQASPSNPVFEAQVVLTLADGSAHPCNVACLMVWAEDGDAMRKLGVAGRIVVAEGAAA